MTTRRQFLLSSLSSISAAWFSAHCSCALAAARCAREIVQSEAAGKFLYFSPEMAAEIDSLTARILPTDETPGAREEGVVYFIDRALVTFAKDDQNLYDEGLADLRARVRRIFPGVERFSAASEAQQDELIGQLDESGPHGSRPFGNRPADQSFFETLRQHTIAGFLIDPESDRLGNRGGLGWRLIGREREHMFQPPFGHYDQDYAGWQLPGFEAGKR